MPELTTTDRRLIAALRENARASITELAHIAGVSRTTVKTRIDALVSDGRIRKFTIETDADQQDQVRAITTIELQGSMSRAVIRTLRAIPEVSSIHSTNGAWDLVVEVRAESLQQFDRILREIREVKGVLNSETSLLLSSVIE
ncbi:DNA-binding transcriptional regulator AsnC [Thalassovita gelatinovora]|uniref:DNA-binding transcriptional regulator AsnC n=1 Tax=Thalassovita gelatinovora TaxID=53501 RepID=A0A0N7LUU5_THAGE|nr:Lrp/AsnC family transcriptional regulator [Thalassovita gelatinovora]QIZ81343.1 Lrp/AsnC family transcriptional regulator [Thalassovita gelatinovora]CUH64474.1 DNA-binding transcriptional regulator AsnC [Thalassovita gelatinovora]SEP97991.1 transcriptional regulator, AsnC family [Thalassovita gelatinovora]